MPVRVPCPKSFQFRDLRELFSVRNRLPGPWSIQLVPLTLAIDEDEDLRLMAAVAAGERSAQTRLLERIAPRVHRLALLLTRSPADADDAAQLALLEILRSAGSFGAPANLVAWSDRIAARVVLESRRRERFRESLLFRWLTPGAQPWGGEGHVSAAQDGVGLAALFAKLSPERREVVVLRHALGYSQDEIAGLTGAPVGTVKDRLTAARKQLRRLLERDSKRLERGGER